MKTKIIRIVGAELYFKRHEMDGRTLWEEYCKDQSALMRCDWHTKFQTTGSLRTNPVPHQMNSLRAPIPDNYATDLLGEYSRLEYAEGHKPSPEWRMV